MAGDSYRRGLARHRNREAILAEARESRSQRYTRLALVATWAMACLAAGIAVLGLLYPLYLRHLDNARDYNEDMRFLEALYPNIADADVVADSEKGYPIKGGTDTDWHAVELKADERLQMWQTQRTGVAEMVSQIWRMSNSAHAVRPVQCLINSEINGWSAIKLVAQLHGQKAPESRIADAEQTAQGAINSRAPCIARIKATVTWLRRSDGTVNARPVPLDICSIADFVDQCADTVRRYTDMPGSLD